MNGKPALVVVTSSFPINGDGSEAAGAFVADFAEELAKRVSVRVVAPGWSDVREQWAEGVEVFRYATPDQPLSTLRPWHPLDALSVFRVLLAGQRATERAVAAGPTAHVLALWALPCGQWARRSARQHGIGYSVWTLGSDIWSLGRIPMVRGLLRNVLREAGQCWSDGLKLRDDTRDIAGRPVEFLPSTRRIERMRAEPPRLQPPYRLLFLGRWHPNKGVDLLLDALETLDDEDWARIEAVSICGGGPLEPVVRAGVARLQVADRPVAMRGFLARDEAQDAMLDADYLLVPSRIESIPVVFSDAMKLGCPVVVCPVGDLPGLVAGDDTCGVVASSVTPAGFAEALRHAIRMPAGGFTDGVGRMRHRFDIDAIAGQVVARTVG